MDEYLTIDDITKALKMSKKTLYNYIKDGKIKAVKKGRRYYVAVAEFNEFMTRDTRKGS